MRFNVGLPVEDARAVIKRSIDEAANHLRAARVTPGQEMTYLLQEQEAARVLGGEKYLRSEIPHIVVEAKVTCVTIEAAAALIRTRARETRHELAVIKGRVRKAKLAVDAAGSLSEARRIAARAFRRMR